MSVKRGIREKWDVISRTAADPQSRKMILRLSVLRYNYPLFGLLRSMVWNKSALNEPVTIMVKANGTGKPVKFTLRPSDIGDVASLFENWIESPPPFSDFAKPTFAVDAGAHIGSFSLMMHSLYPSCTIIALEPNRLNADILKQNFSANGVGGKILEAALWHEDNPNLSFSATESNAGIASEARENDKAERVAGMTLASIAGDNLKDLDVLKLDIEGAEYALLPGVLSVAPENCRIWMELHNVNEKPGWLSKQLKGTSWGATLHDSFPPHEMWLLTKK